MSKNQLNLSDLIRKPEKVHDIASQINRHRIGDDDEYVKEYGIGIDCHSKFIEVCIRYPSNRSIKKAQNTFHTDWGSLVRARDWCLEILRTKAVPVPNLDDPLHYLVESTANYHSPVCMAFSGCSTIINPTIAGAAKRKTDVLDSQMLALHDQIGIWRECYIPNEDVKALRVMIAERGRCIHEATAASNRINNLLTFFGYTLGREGSVVRNPNLRRVIEDLISDNPPQMEGLCPTPIPYNVRLVLRSELEKFDTLSSKSNEWKNKIFEKARSMQWETDNGVLPGDEMIRILSTAPQIGERTAIIWLARVVTPRRFPNSKALSAYCGLDPSLKISAGKVTSTAMHGGNKDLHKALNSSAHRLIYRHNEMFGIWGSTFNSRLAKRRKPPMLSRGSYP